MTNILQLSHVQEKYTKKATPPQKAEDEIKTLAFAQAKLSGNTCFICGKKSSYVHTYFLRKTQLSTKIGL